MGDFMYKTVQLTEIRTNENYPSKMLKHLKKRCEDKQGLFISAHVSG